MILFLPSRVRHFVIDYEYTSSTCNNALRDLTLIELTVARFVGTGVLKPITRVGTLIVATIYLQLIQNRYMFRSFTVLHCIHQHCVQPVASDVEVVGYL